MSDLLTWADVARLHQTIAGISIKKGIVISLLCNTGKGGQYPNEITNNGIKYVANSKTIKGGVNALKLTLKNKIPFRVFQKIGVNQWKDIGFYKVNSFEEKGRGIIEFILKKAL